jgi:hypothetical protein
MSNILAWIHLFGMNIGGPGTTYNYDICGVAGSGLLSLFIEGQLGNQDVTIMNFLCTYIAFFIVILSIGVICGGITYLMVYRSKT